MLRLLDMDYKGQAILREGELAPAEARGWVALVNESIAGNVDPKFFVDVVQLDDFPVAKSTGLYVTVPGHRIFLALMEFQPTCRVNVVDVLNNAEAIYQADYTSDFLRSALSTAMGARGVLREWSDSLSTDLRHEQVTRDVAVAALKDAVEDVTKWDAIPLDTQVYAYAWVIGEAVH